MKSRWQYTIDVIGLSTPLPLNDLRRITRTVEDHFAVLGRLTNPNRVVVAVKDRIAGTGRTVTVRRRSLRRDLARLADRRRRDVRAYMKGR